MTTSHPTIKWKGVSGVEYTYYIWPRGVQFGPDQPSNYIYAKQDQKGYWVPIYIGETSDLNQRLSSNHEKEPCVNTNGATHLHVHLSPGGDDARRAEEADLIKLWQPPCNIQGIR